MVNKNLMKRMATMEDKFQQKMVESTADNLNRLRTLETRLNEDCKQKLSLMTTEELIKKDLHSDMIKDRDAMITLMKDQMRELEDKLKEQIENGEKDQPTQLAKKKSAGSIEIDISDDGSYHITQWQDPNQNYDLDGMIFEVFQNDEG